jgi:hypothetical protein
MTTLQTKFAHQFPVCTELKHWMMIKQENKYYSDWDDSFELFYQPL